MYKHNLPVVRLCMRRWILCLFICNTLINVTKVTIACEFRTHTVHQDSSILDKAGTVFVIMSPGCQK